MIQPPGYLARAIAGACIAIAATTTALAQPLPEGWRASGSAPQKYAMTQSGEAAFEGRYGVSIRSIAPADPKVDFGTIIQAASALPWRGQRVALRAWIKTQHAESAQMWLRIDGIDRSIFMDNMDKRPIVGTTGWWQYEIVMDVPQEAAYLVYGAFLVGGGEVDIDHMQFEAVPVTVETTKKIYKEGQLHVPKDFVYRPPSVVNAMPTNLDFEQVATP